MASLGAGDVSPFDPSGRLDPGEDHFMIREKDPAGPATLTEWARLRRMLAIRQYGFDAEGDARRLYEAEIAQANAADAKGLEWKERQNGGPAIEGGRATYADAQFSAEQVAAAKRQKHHAELVRLLSEADYHAAELVALDGAAVSFRLAAQAAELHELTIAVRFGDAARVA